MDNGSVASGTRGRRGCSSDLDIPRSEFDALNEFGGAVMLVKAEGVHVDAAAGMDLHQGPGVFAVVGIFAVAGLGFKGRARGTGDDLPGMMRPELRGCMEW